MASAAAAQVRKEGRKDVKRGFSRVARTSPWRVADDKGALFMGPFPTSYHNNGVICPLNWCLRRCRRSQWSAIKQIAAWSLARPRPLPPSRPLRKLRPHFRRETICPYLASAEELFAVNRQRGAADGLFCSLGGQVCSLQQIPFWRLEKAISESHKW